MDGSIPVKKAQADVSKWRTQTRAVRGGGPTRIADWELFFDAVHFGADHCVGAKSL